MKQRKKIESIEQLNAKEMAYVKGGFSFNGQMDNKSEAQSTDNSHVIYINGKPYLIEKDGSLRPV